MTPPLPASSTAAAAPKGAKANYDRVETALAREEEEMEHYEEMMEAAPASPSAMADEAFTAGLAQMKRSSKDMFEEEEEE